MGQSIFMPLNLFFSVSSSPSNLVVYRVTLLPFPKQKVPMAPPFETTTLFVRPGPWTRHDTRTSVVCWIPRMPLSLDLFDKGGSKQTAKSRLWKGGLQHKNSCFQRFPFISIFESMSFGIASLYESPTYGSILVNQKNLYGCV